MKHYLRFSLTLLLLVLVGGVGFAQTTIWSEDWSSAKKDQKPSEVNSNYSETGSGTKVYTSQLSSGGKASPELLIASKSGSWTVKISDLKNCTGELTLTYMCNKNLTVKANDNAIKTTASGNSYSAKFNVAEDVKELILVFSNALAKNARIDDIVLTGLASGQTETTKTITTFGPDIDNQTFTLTEGDEFPQYTAHTTDADGNAVAGTIKYTSDNACVTVLDNGQTIGAGYGTAKITATFTPAEPGKYEASSASYTLEVKDPNVVSLDFSTMGYTNTEVVNNVFVDGVSIKLTEGGNLEPKYYTSDKTLRLYTNGTMTISVPESAVITKLNISGKDLDKINSKTGTYKNGTWTGCAKEIVFSATATIKMISIDVTLRVPYTWNDTNDNVIEVGDNQTVKINRTVVKDEYNTICLPFDMTGKEIADAFGEGTKVYSFGYVEENTLIFGVVNEIKAGEPFLLKPTETKNEIVYTGYIYNELPLEPATYGEYKFIGTYSPATLKTDGTNLFFVAGAKLAKPESDQNNANKLKGFRAYMEVPAASANALKVCIDGITASINDIKSDMTISDGKVYNLNGQYVGSSMQNLTKGVYVQNGKKYVVK